MQHRWKLWLAGLSLAVLSLTLFVMTRSTDLRTHGLKELRSGDPVLGESLLETHLKQNPNDKLIRRQLADYYARRGPFEKAIQHLQYLSNDPESGEESLRLLAALAIKSSDAALAEKSLARILELHPADFAANLALGELYFNSGRAVEAIPMIEACIKADPDRAASYLLLADALGEAGRNQEMIKPLEACLRLSPQEFAAHANLAFACYSAGRSGDAILHAQWCLDRQPDFHKVRLILAQAQRDRGEFEASVENLQTVVAAQPDNLDAALLQSDLLFFRGDGRLVYDKLIPFYDQHQQSRKLVSHLMRAAIAKGDREQAQKLQKVLSGLIPE